MPRTTENLPQKILDTALRLFSEKGYFNTSVQDIRRAAGVSIGAIYHHFDNKEGIAQALVASILERFEQAVADIAEEQTSAEAQCRAVVEMLFRMTEEDPRTMAFALYAKHREFMPEQPPICSSAPFERMREMVRRGMDDGEVRPGDPMIASAVLFGGPMRMIQLRLDGVITRPLPELLAETWDSAWRAIGRES